MYFLPNGLKISHMTSSSSSSSVVNSLHWLFQVHWWIL